MAHNVTERDGLFVVRQPAWHGLGEVLPEHPTREVAQKIAHDWEPITEPVYRLVPYMRHHGDPGGDDCDLGQDECSISEHLVPAQRYEQIDGFQATVRSDSGDTLGVVTDTYEPVKNAEMYDIAEAIEGEAKGSVRFETGGSLMGGRKVWLLIRLNEPLMISGDPLTATIPYYALQNAHDGSGAFRGQATMTRIVCDNTAKMADLDAQTRGTEFTFRHTSRVSERIEEAKAALAGWRESVQAYRLLGEHLMRQPVTERGRALFIEEFIPMPPPHAVSDRVVHNVEVARAQLRSILDGPTCESINHSAYGLVQASIEYLNHHRKARSAETRFKRAYLDRDRITSDALELAQKVEL